MTSLSKKLEAADRRAGLEALAAAWRAGVVTVRLSGGDPASIDANLAGRVRGALGAVLKDSASAEARRGEPCPWQPPSAFDVLFRCQGDITPALEIPKPYVLAIDQDGEARIVRLSLQGLAAAWQDDVATALVEALERRIPALVGWEIVDRRIEPLYGCPVPTHEQSIIMTFQSPLELRFRHGPPATGADAMASLVASLGNRVSGLARWQSMQAEADWPRLKKQAEALEVTTLDGTSASWRRYSHRQARTIPMQGHRPTLRLEGDLAPLMPLLAIGAEVHAGSHAALGMGRYRLAPA